MWGIIGLLTIASVLLPAPLGPAADPLRLPASTPTDVVVAWWLPVSERLPPGAVWSFALAGTLLVLLVPRLSRRAREGLLAPSTVDPRLCTGCNQCPQDCPWDAITMVARSDDRPTLVAMVDPSRCVSCGICAGSCAPMGVGPPGRSGRDQLAELRAVALPILAEVSTAPIVAVCCAQAPASHVSALRNRGAQIHQVTCVGNLHSSVVELFIRNGARGVIVCGCPPRDCVSREGPKWLRERFFNNREAELQPRVDRQRVCVATLAPGDLAGTVRVFEQFSSALAALALPERENDAEIDALCEPMPLEEASR
jgi:ferredoxin